MSKALFLLTILLWFAHPATLQASGMEGMGLEVYLQTKAVGSVTFSHTKHGSNCSECHPKIFQQDTKRHRPATMIQMEKGRSCGACHNGKKAFSVTENCTTCHAGDIVYKNAEEGNVTFPHSAHIEMFGCAECHPPLFIARRGANKSSMEDMENGKSCGACHNGDAAFSVAEACESCHQM